MGVIGTLYLANFICLALYALGLKVYKKEVQLANIIVVLILCAIPAAFTLLSFYALAHAILKNIGGENE